MVDCLRSTDAKTLTSSGQSVAVVAVLTVSLRELYTKLMRINPTTQFIHRLYLQLEALLKELQNLYVLKSIGSHGPAKINQVSGAEWLNGDPIFQANGLEVQELNML